MLTRFINHLSQNLSFLKGTKLLLAVSGGIDSMVLAHLLQQSGYDIALAHCNFGLRGEESDGDEVFVRNYAAQNTIKIFVTHFDTAAFASDNKLSVQVAARQLRYMWFDEILSQNNIDYLLTAHHLDDTIETFLINFTRGTGLEGLTGIPEQNGKTVRPLLPFTRFEIEAYAAENNLKWREDSSNASDKYLRNKIRHDVVPLLKSLNPSFDDSFSNTIKHLKQSQSLADDASVLVYRQVVTEKENQKHINIQQLMRLPNYRAYLYQWLYPLGFTAWEDIYSLTEAQSGKYVVSAGYRLLKDRDILLLEPLKAVKPEVYEIFEADSFIAEPVKLRIDAVAAIPEDLLKNAIYVDKKRLKFPLFVRKWEEGDFFYPRGMNGQKKKVSKFFKDEKLSLSEKEDTWLLCSENRIVWVIGKRADERFKADTKTTQILKIEVL